MRRSWLLALFPRALVAAVNKEGSEGRAASDLRHALVTTRVLNVDAGVSKLRRWKQVGEVREQQNVMRREGQWMALATTDTYLLL